MNFEEYYSGLFSSGEATGAFAQLFALLLFAKANTIWRSSGMTEYPHVHLFVRSSFVLVLLIILALLIPSLGFPKSIGSVSILTISLGAFGGLGLLLFAKALSTIPSRLVFFGGTFQLITGLIVGYALLEESINFQRLLVVVCLLIVQITLVIKDIESWKKIPQSKRWSPLIIGIIWGVYYPLIGLVESRTSIWQTILFSEFGVFISFLGALLIYFKKEKAAFQIEKTFTDMFKQASYSLTAQTLSVLCLKLGGVIFQSILSSFSNLLYLMAFKIAFKEKYDLRYILYFIGYGLLVTIL